MGGGSSTNKTAYSAPIDDETPSRADPAQRALPFLATTSIEASVNMSVNSINSMKHSELDGESKDLLIEAFGDFFMLDGDDYNSLRTKLLLQACKRESSPVNSILMREGEVGNKLYVIQSGHLEVSIEGIVVRHMSSGALIGELSLLYNAPRSATVKCLTPCTFFVLTRDAFKQIQCIASSASLLRRSRWLQGCADVLSLGVVDISRLAGALETQYFVRGDKIYTEGEDCNRIYLFEEGSAIIKCSDGVLNALSTDEIQRCCGITTPLKTTFFSPEGLGRLPELCEDEHISSAQVADALLEVEQLGSSTEGGPDVDPFGVFEGYVICTNLISQCDSTMPQKFHIKCTNRIGAKMPFSVVVTSDKLQCSYFTVDAFKHMFGSYFDSNDDPTDKNISHNINANSSSCIGSGSSDLNRAIYISEETVLLSPDHSPDRRSTMRRNRGGSRLDDSKPKKIAVYTDGSFKELCLLGKGSYGTVVFVKEILSGDYYAIKRICKSDVTSPQHLRHIYDECKLLVQMQSPFIVNLLGMYMTPDEIVLVMEPALYGDLWGVIYEVKKHSRGLPVDLIKFYTTSLVLGLDHIHKRGIAFRDLKPGQGVL
jgi:hypothetical protein